MKKKLLSIVALLSAAALAFGQTMLPNDPEVKTGKLENGFMISKSIDVSQAKDPAGYIAYMYVKTIVVCALVVLLGIFQMISDYTEGFGIIPAITSAVILVVLIVYGIAAVRAQKKYLQ